MLSSPRISCILHPPMLLPNNINLCSGAILSSASFILSANAAGVGPQLALVRSIDVRSKFGLNHGEAVTATVLPSI